jgi:hypothetical protein
MSIEVKGWVCMAGPPDRSHVVTALGGHAMLFFQCKEDLLAELDRAEIDGRPVPAILILEQEPCRTSAPTCSPSSGRIGPA